MILETVLNIILKNTSTGEKCKISKIIERLKVQYKQVDTEMKPIKILKEKMLTSNRK
jgi:hypothetical protein